VERDIPCGNAPTGTVLYLRSSRPPLKGYSMSRRYIVLTLAIALFLPAPTSAQVVTPDPQVDDAEQAAEAAIFMSAIEYIRRLHMQSYNDSTLWTRALDGLIGELDDPYASVFTPSEVEDFQEETTGNYAGIGISISQLNDVVTVTSVFRGTPASQAGLQVGDVIVGVNDNDATTWNTTMASDSIRGPVGTVVDLRVIREGVRQPIPISMQRDSVHVASVQSDILPDNIGYLSIDRVARNSAHEVMEAIDSLAETRGVIIDLRRNPGGYLDESLTMSDVFLGRGAVLASTRDRGSRRTPGKVSEESYRGRLPARIPDKPIIILVDRFTASAAEIVTGALQDHDRALVLGERTFGKGIVQSVVDLPYGRKLRITTGSWHTPLGRSLHRDRDPGGNPLPENLDTLSSVRTPHGRILKIGGGIFPDLVVEADTIGLLERELISTANDQEVPLATREAEVSFARAKALLEAGEPPSVDDATVQGYISVLEAAGLPAELVDRPEIRSYLRWRLSVSVADRMEDVAAATMARLERDRVLSRAVDLMRDATTQSDLFAAAAEANGSDARAITSAGATPR
jgi:carboxyl-terminal processing protease